jgi:hypothetical protein
VRTDLLPKLLHHLACRIGIDMNARVREDRAVSASDQISAREAGFVTGDLEVHDHLLSSPFHKLRTHGVIMAS